MWWAKCFKLQLICCSCLALTQFLWDKTFSYCSAASFRKSVSCECFPVNWFQHNQCSILVTKQCLFEVQPWAEQDIRCLRKVHSASPLDTGKKQRWESVLKIPVCSAVSLQFQSDPIFCLKWDLFSVCEGDYDSLGVLVWPKSSNI